MLYTDVIEYNTVGDTQALLLRCFTFVSILKAGYDITTGQYINYQTFSNLQLRPLVKTSTEYCEIVFKMRVDSFSTSALLYPKIEIRLRIFSSRPNVYMISENPNFSLAIVGRSRYTRRITLSDDYPEKRKDTLAYTHVECIYLETLIKTFPTHAI